MKHTKSSTFCVVLLIALTLIFTSCSSSQKDAPVADRPKLSVGIQSSPAMTLVMVAEDKGFFDSAGVDVELKEFTAGKFALQAFLGGSLDMAVSGEVPVVLSVLQGHKFQILTQVVERTVNECRVVALKDATASDPAGYFKAKRRKIATSFGGGPEFFTMNFLKKNGILSSQLEIISQRPEDMPAALQSRSVDAISIFDPFARIAEVKLGDSAVTFADPSIYSELYVVSVSEETLSKKSDVLRAFVRGLLNAQTFIQSHPDESKGILIKFTKLDRHIVDDIWGNFVFRAAINQLLLQYMTAEAEWAISEKKVPEGTPIPNFRATLSPEILRQVAPASVVLEP